MKNVNNFSLLLIIVRIIIFFSYYFVSPWHSISVLANMEANPIPKVYAIKSTHANPCPRIRCPNVVDRNCTSHCHEIICANSSTNESANAPMATYRKSHFTKTALNRQNTIIAHNASPVSTGIQLKRLDNNPIGIKMAAATM